MKNLRFIILSVVAMLCTGNVWGQYSISMEQVQLSNYRSVSYDFDLTDICSALGVDTADFVNDFYDFTSYPDLVTLETDDHSTNYTQGSGGRGYWMSADGKAVEWNTTDCKFCVLPVPSVAANRLRFTFWQMPDVAQVGDKYHCEIAINYNDKQLTFDINVTVIEKKNLELETELSKLNILGTIETTTTQEPRNNYNSDQVTMDISQAIEALGLDAKVLSENLSDYLYMAVINTESDSKDANLSNKWTANSGFWTGLYFDENVGEETGELINGYGSSNWKVYIEAFHFDPETGILTANVGQNPNSVGTDVKWWIPMYLINKSDAYILRVNFNTKEAEPDEDALDFDKQTKVGEQNYTIDIWSNNNYRSWTVTLDIDSIVALIGEDKSNIALRAESAEGEISTNTTANNGGYWLDENGFVIAYGTGAFTAVEPSSDLSTLYIMQYPNTAEVGQTRTLRLYIVGKRAHYQLNITINVVEQQGFDLSEYELVADENYEYQIVPSDGDWTNDDMNNGIQLGVDRLKELLGDGSYKFLGEKELSEGKTLITDEYTLDPSPAFWMTGDYVHSYTGQDSYGIRYSASGGKLHFYKVPNHNQVGEHYQSNFWLANPTTKKYMHFLIYVEYVNEIVNYENVGNASVVLPLYSDEGDYVETSVDMADVYAALGCEADEFRENAVWKIKNQDGMFTTDGYEDEMYGFWFDKDGNPTTEEASKAYSLEFLDAESSDSGENCFRTFAFVEGVYRPVACVEYNGKRYVFNIVICSDPTGISNVKANSNEDQTIYDLTGRKVSRALRGIYIQNGKKYIVR